VKICMVGLGIGKSSGVFVGGHVNNVINLSKKLIESGHHIHLVTTLPIHSKSLRSEFSKIAITTIKVKGDYFNVNPRYVLEFIPKAILKIKRLHKKERFDIIHGHSGFPLIGLVSEVAGALSAIPTMHTLYCPLGGSWISRKISRYYLRKMDIISVLSENTKRSLKAVVPESKIRIIPPLVDISLYSSCISRRLAESISGRKSSTILFLGNLKKAKGLDILLEGLSSVKKNFPDVRLLIGLDIPLEKFISQNCRVKYQIKSLGLEKNVFSMGIIKDLPQAMIKSSIFVAPFRNTHGPADCPLSILEAMASGLPVVATNVGGIPEVIKHGEHGLLVEPNDPAGLGKSISYLLENKMEAIRMGNNGAKFVLDISKNIIEDLELVYRDILK